MGHDYIGGEHSDYQVGFLRGVEAAFKVAVDVRLHGIDAIPEGLRPCEGDDCNHRSCHVLRSLDICKRLNDQSRTEAWTKDNPHLAGQLRDLLGSDDDDAKDIDGG